MQSVWNLMFTFIGSVYLAILTHHHHNNVHNNIDNNYDNTVSATHTPKSPFCLPTLTEVALYATVLYHALQAIYTFQKATLSNKKVCREAFCHWCWQYWAPLASHFSWFTPHILISLKDNSSFGSVRLITVDHLPIKAEWLDAPLMTQVFSQSIANTPHSN